MERNSRYPQFAQPVGLLPHDSLRRLNGDNTTGGMPPTILGKWRTRREARAAQY